MAAKAPFWEIKATLMTREVNGFVVSRNRTEFYAHLKGRNGKIIAHTEIYPQKASVKKALEVANPDGVYEVRDISGT